MALGAMVARPVAAGRWAARIGRRVGLVSVLCAVAAPAAAQIVRPPKTPPPAGEGQNISVILPASWDSRSVTFETRGFSEDTFLHRATRVTADCPADSVCYVAGLQDRRTGTGGCTTSSSSPRTARDGPALSRASSRSASRKIATATACPTSGSRCTASSLRTAAPPTTRTATAFRTWRSTGAGRIRSRATSSISARARQAIGRACRPACTYGRWPASRLCDSSRPVSACLATRAVRSWWMAGTPTPRARWR